MLRSSCAVQCLDTPAPVAVAPAAAPAAADILLLHGLGVRLVIVCGATQQVRSWAEGGGRQECRRGCRQVCVALAPHRADRMINLGLPACLPACRRLMPTSRPGGGSRRLWAPTVSQVGARVAPSTHKHRPCMRHYSTARTAQSPVPAAAAALAARPALCPRLRLPRPQMRWRCRVL